MTNPHLPGVIMAESSISEICCLLGNRLGGIHQAMDETAAMVASHEFDPYGNPTDNGFTGQWQASDLGLLPGGPNSFLPR